ncbi:MAG: hypothetical protein AAF411_21020 [Myxococcota bacterium]
MRARTLCLMAAAAAFAAWWPLFTNWENTGFGDWVYFQRMWEAARVGLERHGGMPYWDPYHCGGLTLWGNPQSMVYGPLILLAPLVGSTLALKVFVVLHVAFAFYGMHRLATYLGLDPPGATAASVAFSCCGFFAWHYGGGHVAFGPFGFAPWLLLCWRKSPGSLRHTLGVAVLMALTLFEGGVYPLPYFVLWLAFDALLRIRKGVLKVVGAGLLAGVLALFASAARLIPTMQTLARFPREVPARDEIAPVELLQMLTSYEGVPGFSGRYVWAEYASYVGFSTLVLAVLGALIYGRKHRRVLYACVFFALLCLGDFAPWSPWRLLHHLPIYSSLRVPSRFVILLILHLALLAGAGVQAIGATLLRERRRWSARYVPWLIAGAVAAEVLLVARPLPAAYSNRPLRLSPPSERFYLTTTPYLRVAEFPARNVGTRGCYEAYEIPLVYGLRNGDVPQVVVENGSLEDEGRRPDHLWANVTMEGDGLLRFNQRYDSAWIPSVGVAEEERLRLTVRVPEGTERVDLHFRPPHAGLAWLLTALGWLAIVALWLVDHWRGRRRPIPKG